MIIIILVLSLGLSIPFYIGSAQSVEIDSYSTL